MKKIIASAGFTMLGAASLHAAYDPGILSPQERSKFWTVGLDLSGFYDSNYNAAPSGTAQSSWGINVAPNVAINLLLDQTVIGLTDTYDMRWYADRPNDQIDQQNVLSLNITHGFSETLKLSVSDTFIVSDQPDVLDQGNIITSPALLLRSDQSALANTGTIALTYDFTPQYGIEVSYNNGWYDYQQKGPGSLSALLDRLDNKAALNFRWFANPATTVILGYQYEWLNYTSSESLNQFASGPLYVNPNVRNFNSNYIYVGVDHDFTAELSVSLRIGAQITDYVNLHDYYPNEDDSQITPYADLSFNWVYNPGCYVKVGVRSTLNSTDVAYVNSITPVLNQQSTAAYTTWNHRITPRLTSTVLGLFQASEFNGGGSGVDGETDLLGLVGINFNYKINTFLSADAGYNYDRLDSDLPGRSYTRNRGYFGFSAKY